MTHSYASYSYFRALIRSEEQHRDACREAHEQDRGQAAGVASASVPLEAMALKFTLMPSAAMAMPSTMYAKSTSCGVMEVTNGTKVPIIEAPMKPSMNHGKATVFLPVL